MVTRGKPPETWAYTAGIIDGEGHVGIYRTAAAKVMSTMHRRTPRYQAVILVVSSSKILIDWLHEEFGGSVQARRQEKLHHKPTWRWHLSDSAILDFCKGITPYARVKLPQLLLLIEYFENRTLQPRHGPGEKSMTSPEELLWRESMHHRMLTLNDNRGRPQRLTETASRTDDVTV